MTLGSSPASLPPVGISSANQSTNSSERLPPMLAPSSSSSSSTTSRLSRSSSVMPTSGSLGSPPIPLPTGSPSTTKRSLSVSEGFSVRRASIRRSQEAIDAPHALPPATAANASTTSFTHISETNWANRLEDFDMQTPIGYGSSAVVYCAIYKPLNKKVAVKVIDLDMFERNQIDELRRETALMVLSKHPNILPVYGSFVNGSKLYIVTPYLSWGSCLDIMKTGFSHGMDETSIATILKQALEGLWYLHRNGHIHRDVKAGNLLMDDHGGVVLGDFGVSSSLTGNGDVRKTFVGTPCWMAPEVMEQAAYDYKADIWSFGITALELATGHAPFAKYPPMKVLKMTLSNDPPTLDREATKYKYSKSFKEMIDSCLQKDPKKRPTAEKLLQHPFFRIAKKKDYLVKSTLAVVPPLHQRPHKRIPEKPVHVEEPLQWDFDTMETTEKPQPTAPRRHISFGDAVIRDVSKPGAEHHSQHASPHASPDPPKKSRFVVDDQEGQPAVLDKSPSVSPPILPMDATPPTSTSGSFSATASNGSGVEGEVRKGRFSVNHQSRPSLSFVDGQLAVQQDMAPPMARADSASERKSRFEVHLDDPLAIQDFSPGSFPRNSSVSSKSSRFSVEVEHPREVMAATAAAVAATDLIHPTAALPAVVKKSRFELSSNSFVGTEENKQEQRQEEKAAGSESSPSTIALSPPTSPYASISRGQGHRAIEPTHRQAAFASQVEILLKHTELQRQLLLDMLATQDAQEQSQRPTEASTRKLSQDSADLSRSSGPTTDLLSLVEHMQQVLFKCERERSRLIRENDMLRYELRRLQKDS